MAAAQNPVPPAPEPSSTGFSGQRVAGALLVLFAIGALRQCAQVVNDAGGPRARPPAVVTPEAAGGDAATRFLEALRDDRMDVAYYTTSKIFQMLRMGTIARFRQAFEPHRPVKGEPIRLKTVRVDDNKAASTGRVVLADGREESVRVTTVREGDHFAVAHFETQGTAAVDLPKPVPVEGVLRKPSLPRQPAEGKKGETPPQPAEGEKGKAPPQRG